MDRKDHRFLSQKINLILAGLIYSGLAPHLLADGKFFVREDVPAGEPFQRALIVHGDGREFLLVQPQLVGSGKEFAWVLPVPASPELGHLDTLEASDLFSVLDMHARPEVVRWRYLVLLGLSIGIIAWTLISRLSWGKKLAISLGVPLVWLLCLYFWTGMMTAGLPAGSEVEILGMKQVGIYETTTVRSTNPEAMKEWLEQRGFRTGPEEGAALRSYIEHGWCFVAMKIAAKEAGIQDGLIQPLALDFPSPNPVYPFALTATGGGETRVVLYVYSAHKVGHPAFQTTYAGPGSGMTLWSVKEGPGPWKLFWDPEYGIKWASSEGKQPPACPPNPGLMTKLRGTLSSKNVQGDVVLRPAADDTMLREIVWRW